MTAFRVGGPAGRDPESPEALFRDLPRPAGPVQHLWSHQADLLRSYVQEHSVSADVALELPTGAGKTLVGLLLAEWRRRTQGERVAYLCPTRQLARQTEGLAASYGIRTVTLLGSHRDWSAADLVRFQSASAIALTTYAAVFNSNPRIDVAQALVLDDAHAGEGWVSGAWTITASRGTSLYRGIVDTIGGLLDPAFLVVLRDDDAEPVFRKTIDLLPIAALDRIHGPLLAVLDVHAGEERFALSMMRGSLRACLVYVSWREISVRPYIPPTFQHLPFSGASQRIYMSATLGDGGELERAFGRSPIARLPLPPGWDRQGNGRRFFVFADLVENFDSAALRDTISGVGKAVVLCPDGHSARQFETSCRPDDMRVLRAEDIETSLDVFARADRAVLVLTNRYDGIDLPDDACRLIILYGLPAGTHLQERFLLQSLGAVGVLDERIRTRIVQGSGRCTRNATDYAAVFACGTSLAGFCARRDTQGLLHPELQAEILFGLDNSELPADEVQENLRAFLSQDRTWQEGAEPEIRRRRDGATTIEPAEARILRSAAGHEVGACQAAWRGEWGLATQRSREVVDALAGGVAVRPYRGLWAYFASAWAALAASQDSQFVGVSSRMLDAARAASRGSTWLARVERASGVTAATTDDLLTLEQVLGASQHFVNVGPGTRRFEGLIQDMERRLSSRDATQYELGLKDLGYMLGFETDRPPGDGTPDSTWIAGTILWIAFEAKSDSDAPLSIRDVRQANTHLRWMGNRHRLEAPEGSFTTTVAQTATADAGAGALAEPNVFVITSTEIQELARSVVAAWRKTRGETDGLDEGSVRDSLRGTLGEMDCLGPNLRGRLARRQLQSLH